MKFGATVITALLPALAFGVVVNPCRESGTRATLDLPQFEMSDIIEIGAEIADSGSNHLGVYEIKTERGMFALKTTWAARPAESYAVQQRLSDEGLTPRIHGIIPMESLRAAGSRFAKVDPTATPDLMKEAQVLDPLGKVWNVTHSHNPMPAHASQWNKDAILTRIALIERRLEELQIHLPDPQIAITREGVPYLIDVDEGAFAGTRPVKPMAHVRERFLAKWQERFGGPSYATTIKDETKGRQIGEGSSGPVYEYETTLPTGEKLRTVKKTLLLETGEAPPVLETKVRAYELAARLGMGPRLAAAVPQKSLFLRTPYVAVSLEYVPGINLATENWPRNNLPEKFEDARRMFGGYVVLKDAWKNTTRADYARLVEKADAIRDVHPDPTPENIRFVSRIVEGKAKLDVIAVDWEDAGATKMPKVVKQLEEMAATPPRPGSWRATAGR